MTCLNNVDEFNVTCFQVVINSGGILNHALSPLLETIEQARSHQNHLIEAYPKCRISKQTFWHDRADEPSRLDLLSEIVISGGVA